MLCPGPLQDLSLGRSDNGLDFRGVNETGNIRIVNLGGRKEVILLLYRSFVESAEDFVKGSKCTLGPNNEAAQVTTRSKLQKAETTDIADFNTGKITEGFDDAIVFTIDNKGTATLAVTPVSHFTLTGTKFPRVGNFDDINIGVKSLEESDSLFGLLEGLDGAANHERNFLNLFNTM